MFQFYSISLIVSVKRMLEIQPMILSMFLTNVLLQIAIAITSLGCIFVLYAFIAKYGGHVIKSTASKVYKLEGTKYPWFNGF